MTLKELVKAFLTKAELSSFKGAYDIVGDIAIFELDENLKKKEKKIAKCLIDLNKNIGVVVKKETIHKGKYRIQKYKHIFGEKRFETEYKENGVRIKLDINKTYFSVRLSNERARIAKQVKNGENVLVMFSGVGVYPLVIAKNSRPNLVYGVELNKSAHKYALENVRLNNFNRIKLFNGDVREIVPKLDIKFDRIVMPLPKDAGDFLDLIKLVAKRGCFVHFYCFGKEDEIKSIKKGIKEKIKCRILNIVKCGKFSPRVYRFCVDFKVL